MRMLSTERSTLARLVPGLDDYLAGVPLAELEAPDSKAIAAFREHGGAGLLVPAEHHGTGASALEAVRVQRAVGARCPSLAVATTMHHFSVASLVALSRVSPGSEWVLLQAIAEQNLLVASGFAEGRPGGNILHPTMTATVAEDGVRVSGVKRPCSLARSMDLLTASVQVPGPDGQDGQLVVALIPATAPGIAVSPFWGSFALAGAQSDQVTLTDVPVPEELLVRTETGPGEGLDAVQAAGFLWFELLLMGSYLGAASALVERVLHQGKAAEGERLRVVADLEGAVAAVENVARQLPDRESDPELLAQALVVRYAVQGAVSRVVPLAVELLGGLCFIGSDEVAYLAAVSHGLGFHPPSRGRMAGPLLAYLSGADLEIA